MFQAVCEECDAALHLVTAASVFGAYIGESEKTLRGFFEDAAAEAQRGKTVVLFFDEVMSKLVDAFWKELL